SVSALGVIGPGFRNGLQTRMVICPAVIHLETVSDPVDSWGLYPVTVNMSAPGSSNTRRSVVSAPVAVAVAVVSHWPVATTAVLSAIVPVATVCVEVAGSRACVTVPFAKLLALAE